MKTSRTAVLLAGMAALLCVPAHAQVLPDGEGKALFQKICSNCHGLDTALDENRTPVGWRSIVDMMVNRGAEGTDVEFDTIVKYLVKNFGKETPAKVSVNKAAAPELASALSLTDSEAGAIVKYRQDNGNFKELADLKKVPGLDFQKIEARKDRLSFD